LRPTFQVFRVSQASKVQDLRLCVIRRPRINTTVAEGVYKHQEDRTTVRRPTTYISGLSRIHTAGSCSIRDIYRTRGFTGKYRCRIYNAVSRSSSTPQVSQGFTGIIQDPHRRFL
jgi:hypothetical protein